MTLWPVLLSLAFLCVAYVVFYMLPELTEHGNSFLYVICAVLTVYVGAALYMSQAIPRVSQFQSLQTTLTKIETVIDNLMPSRLN